MKNEIVIYQSSDFSTKIEVNIADETIWLSQAQIVELFESSKANISEHIKNIFLAGELEEKSVVRNFRTTAADGKRYNVKHYNLDVIISVGYRVNSLRGTQFRIWANKVLKDYLLRGYSLNQRIDRIENNLQNLTQKVIDIDMEIHTALPLKQGIFFDGQVFDAYTFVADLIRSAKHSVILIDNYIDDTVLTLLSKRNEKVSATIYTLTISKQLKLDLKKHNTQYTPVDIKLFNRAHDRFLIIDESELYHIGASLKDLGKKWFAFSKINNETLNILSNLKNRKELADGE